MNFLSPYTACNIKEFWRRWHTSLTQWFTDYIYFSLGGSRTKRWAINMLLVFLISGLWHGAGWNFIIWGGLAGVALIVHRVFHNAGLRLWAPLGWLCTFTYMVLVWMFFYIRDFQLLTRNIAGLFSPEQYNLSQFLAHMACSWRTISHSFVPFFLIFACICLFLEALSWKKYENPYRLFLHPVSCGIMVALMILLRNPVRNDFIYFAF